MRHTRRTEDKYIGFNFSMAVSYLLTMRLKPETYKKNRKAFLKAENALKALPIYRVYNSSLYETDVEKVSKLISKLNNISVKQAEKYIRSGPQDWRTNLTYHQAEAFENKFRAIKFHGVMILSLNEIDKE